MSASKLRMHKLTPRQKLDFNRESYSNGVGNIDLIEAINKLQDKLASNGKHLEISLPQIVVVGSQSAGKSSTLENIVGREFLPRGTGVVTRRPTVVQLIPCKEEYAVFLHSPEVRFTDFEEVKNEISAETNRNPGPEGFSSVPISLKIYSPTVPKLTLVDLPGLIRVTVDNQSEDSIQIIHDMVLNYISQKNCLILAVSPANQDIASSDALEIVKNVDKKGIRTIGVLTKLDLMDEGTDARDVLDNKKIPLARGYVGVLNRSQKDIEDGRDIAYCLDKEEKFFNTMPCYKDISDRMGTVYLRKTLNEQLYFHIKECLPNVRKELSQMLVNVHKDMKEITGRICFNVADPSSIQDYMIKLTQNFIKHSGIQIFGNSVEVSMDELSAGPMINFKLYKGIQQLKQPEVPSQRQLLMAITNLGGVRNSFTMSSLPVETVLNQLLVAYISPLNLLVDDIADILDETVEESSKLLINSPRFRVELISLIRDSISEASLKTKETLEKHMEVEMNFVNTGCKDFTFPDLEENESLFPIQLWRSRILNNSSTKPAIKSDDNNENPDFVSSEIAPTSFCEKDSDDLAEISESIEADEKAVSNANILAKIIERYMNIQHKHVEDIAIKYILFFLVKQVRDFIEKELLGKILTTVDKDIIYKDCEKDFNKLKELEATCECLEDALNAVQTF